MGSVRVGCLAPFCCEGMVPLRLEVFVPEMGKEMEMKDMVWFVREVEKKFGPFEWRRPKEGRHLLHGDRRDALCTLSFNGEVIVDIFPDGHYFGKDVKYVRHSGRVVWANGGHSLCVLFNEETETGTMTNLFR